MIFNKFFNKKFTNFNEFENMLCRLTCTNKEKGDIFEEFVYAYFKLNYDLYDIKEVYMSKDIPEAIINELKLEKIDHGVDGVYLSNENKLIAYQVKFRSNINNPPTYTELSTFLTESENAYSRCTITNCINLPHIIDKKNNHFSILGNSLNELDENFFENLYEITNNKKVVISKKSPREHQIKIINDVVNGFLTNNRGKVISACGTGKTLTALWIIEKLNYSSILFVVPNLALISQTLKEWAKQASSPFSYLCVCSDSTVSSNIDDNSNLLSDLPFPVTTSPDKINEFIKADRPCRKIIFSTYQSLNSLSYALEDLDFSFDIGIFDEAHRTAGAKDGSSFIYGLSDKYIKIKNRLFMTATERVVTTRIKNSLKDTEYEVYSMDDQSVYGPTFSKLNFGQAIEKGIISNYQVVVACVNECDYKKLLNDNKIVTNGQGSIIDIQNLSKELILAKAYQELDICKVISYHQNVAKAKNFITDNIIVKSISECKNIDKSDIYFGHVNGEMPTSEKYVKFKEFENHKYSLLTNARCLTEGVDIPAIDAVYFCDARTSTIDIIQAVGRALRISDKKVIPNQSYIIIPIIIPDGINDIKDCDCKLFETLHSVVQSLRDQDNNLSDTIDELNLSYATSKGGSKGLNDKIRILLPTNINYNDFFDNLSLRIAEVNKEPSGTNTHYAISNVQNARASAFVRRFKTIGDMTAEAYRDSLVLPTIKLFNTENDVKKPSDLKFNHNNYSHTIRMGIIEELNQKVQLTKIGKLLYLNTISFDDLFNQQILLYGELNPTNGQIIFPYRSMLRIMLEVGKLTQLEFLFSLYALSSSSELAEIEAINRIYYIRNEYPNIEILNADNQEKILNILNNKFNLSFSYQDVWTNRSTTYNQFNYFKCHLVHLSLSFKKTSKEISLDENGKENIVLLLKSTNFIESYNNEERKNYYINRERKNACTNN